MPAVTIYTTSWCPYCRAAKDLLQRKGVAFEEIDATMDPSKRAEMMDRSGRMTFPQVFIGDRHVGGCDDLFALERSGQLDEMLNG